MRRPPPPDAGPTVWAAFATVLVLGALAVWGVTRFDQTAREGDAATAPSSQTVRRPAVVVATSGQSSLRAPPAQGDETEVQTEVGEVDADRPIGDGETLAIRRLTSPAQTAAQRAPPRATVVARSSPITAQAPRPAPTRSADAKAIALDQSDAQPAAPASPSPGPARLAPSPVPAPAIDRPTTRSAEAEARIRAALARAPGQRAAAPTPTPARGATPAARPSPRAALAANPVPSPVPSSSQGARPPIPSASGAYTAPALRNAGNKWGVGVYRDSNRTLDVLKETQPGVILLMDPEEGWARRVREVVPDSFIVGRRYKAEDKQQLDNPEQRGVELADWVAERAVPLRGIVDAWMSYNEVLGSNPSEDYPRYNTLQVAFARRLQGTYGIPAVAANDGSGALDPEDYPRYFAEAIRASEYFGVHSYSPPRTSRMNVDAEWNALRYRKIHDELEKAGIRGVKMVITESGLGDGYRPGVATEEEMAADFVWFTRELEKDPYMIGHAAFGLFDATGAWSRFELVDSKVPALVRQQLGRR